MTRKQTKCPTIYSSPICFELISEAYVSRCGHSFCSKCLQRTVESHRRCPKCQLSLQASDIFPNYTCKKIDFIELIERILWIVNAIIEKYRQQCPLPQTFAKYGVSTSSSRIGIDFSSKCSFRVSSNTSQIWWPMFID